jgi:hypothetical protein
MGKAMKRTIPRGPIGATTNKNKAAFERTIDRIVSVLSKNRRVNNDSPFSSDYQQWHYRHDDLYLLSGSE